LFLGFLLLHHLLELLYPAILPCYLPQKTECKDTTFFVLQIFFDFFSVFFCPQCNPLFINSVVRADGDCLRGFFVGSGEDGKELEGKIGAGGIKFCTVLL
jgi:hypothetical protein